MFGRAGLPVGRTGRWAGAGDGLGGGAEPLVVSAAARIARPAPRTPPTARPPFRNVRRSTLLFCFPSMLSMRALILGPSLALGLGLALPVQRAEAASGPACTPATLNNSALQGGAVTVSPLAGSRDASPRTQISFLGVPVGQLRAIRVLGSRTGAHAGRLAPYSQGDGGSFLPALPFAEGERVTVQARVSVGGASRRVLDTFVIGHANPLALTPEAVHPGRAADVQSFLSRPDLHPPAV